MRITDYQLKVIKNIFLKHFSPQDHIWLFGSRVDSNKKGGDIDLYIETTDKNIDTIIEKKILFIVDLKKILGDQKIDVVLNYLHASIVLPIYIEAKTKGIQLL